MNYTVSAIENRADCQVMIDMANEDKDSLEYRKTGLERQHQTTSTTSVSIEADLVAITAELAALQTVYDGLPDGETKDDTQVRITKAQYKKFLLEQRKAGYGSIALLSKEFDIASVDRQLLEVDEYIQALTTRFNELP